MQSSQNAAQDLVSVFEDLAQNSDGVTVFYDQKYDEINTMLNPILMKVQSQAEGPPEGDPSKMNMDMGSMSSEEMKETMDNMEKGPTIDEVD